MSNKQSSVEWLIEEIKKDTNIRLRGFDIDKAMEKAKAMHKHEIEKAHARGEVTGFGRVKHPNFYADKTPEQYYNETYGGCEQ